ncbi:50S ribosomal protein L11 methyltransferase [Gilvimarinus sp. F26214L]|uniref:50S ribosomal protein L11 methyltransferase n=1 Tax=Gilvimarinus sp. DZF01 TaxID=3461371 RepID=UPI004046410A
MAWLQLHVHSSPETAEAIEDALLAAGAASVTFQDRADQPILEPALGETPLWQQTRITGLFDAASDTDGVLRTAAEHLDFPLPEHHWEQLEDKDWEREWMKDYQAIRCAEDLWIYPSWQEPPDSRATNVRLDPGLAFGTGTHPTTLLCLQWLAKQDVSGKQVIDYGCGSGILGIAALMRGASRLTAVDIDPQALLATRENCQRNHIDPEQVTTHLPQAAPKTSAELVFANILAGPLVELAPTLAELTAPGGRLCLAGLLDSQEQEVRTAYEAHFQFEAPCYQDEWVQLAAVRRHP